MTLKFVYGTAVILLAWNAIALAEKSKVIDLNEDNWRAVLEKEWMIEL